MVVHQYHTRNKKQKDKTLRKEHKEKLLNKKKVK